MRFVAIDVETANADRASICSIGVAVFEGGALADEWYSLIDPDGPFNPHNIAIHGITRTMVAGAPSFAAARPELNGLLEGSVVVSHTAFDQGAVRMASERYGLAPPDCAWLDSAKVARRVWADCAQGGYGLKALCRKIGYRFEHHHALEDAKAAGHVLLAAMSDGGLDLSSAMRRAEEPVGRRRPAPSRSAFPQPVKREGNPDGPLFGEVVVFTGPLMTSREEAADRAAALGCRVAQSVSRKVTMLVVGGRLLGNLSEDEKSSKLRAAEQIAESGSAIRIVSEAEFEELLGIVSAGGRASLAS